jgi:RNA polymerase sigma-70 factor (ECF subfamily)
MNLSDPDTFARAYEQHAPGVVAAAQRIVRDPAVAHDVAQDVFLRVWRHPETFDRRRGELGSYLRLMARSRALDLWREGQAAGRAADRLKVVAAREEGRVDDLPAPAAERAGAGAQVRAALRTLPAPQREALVLTYWGGLTADELARRCGVPLGTAKSRIRLAMARLRAEFGAHQAVAA